MQAGMQAGRQPGTLRQQFEECMTEFRSGGRTWFELGLASLSTLYLQQHQRISATDKAGRGGGVHSGFICQNPNMSNTTT